jgi:hypothetical protein
MVGDQGLRPSPAADADPLRNRDTSLPNLERSCLRSPVYAQWGLGGEGACFGSELTVPFLWLSQRLQDVPSDILPLPGPVSGVHAGAEGLHTRQRTHRWRTSLQPEDDVVRSTSEVTQLGSSGEKAK